MNRENSNILEFIGLEHHNELASIANLKGELWFLQELDGIYRETKNALPVSAHNDVQVMASVMFLRTHSEFYAGISQFLKSHLSKAFLSLRIAIDASFNAYYFTKHPDHIKDYADETSPLQKDIFWNIKKHIKHNSKEYPLAQSLITMHELTSDFSAHASFKSLAYKLQHTVSEEQKKEEIKLNYFDGLGSANFTAYYFTLLKGYFMVFQLFYNCFYKQELSIVYPDRERRIYGYETKLNLKHKQYPLKRAEDKTQDELILKEYR